jgi:RES domain-containing protein
MKGREKLVAHEHVPLFRVLRAGHANPLDASHSRFRPGRWNTRSFATLYSCCSEFSARAVARDRLRLAAVEVEDLQPGARPQLSELGWSGRVVDVATPEGVEAAGFAPGYPQGVTHEQTQPRAAEWFRRRREGILCRGASLSRLGFSDWSGQHERWGELAIFVETAAKAVTLVRTRSDLDWLA